jgi:hypothetical protein
MMLRYDIKRKGTHWQLATGSRSRTIVSSPDRNVVLSAAHSIVQAYGGLLSIYDLFDCLQARYTYLAGRGCVPPAARGN